MLRILNICIALGLTGAVLSVMIPTLLLCSRLPRKRLIRLQGLFLHLWARLLTRGLRIKVRVSGPLPPRDQDRMYLVSNHCGYLDILILASVWPLTFVSRHDLARWPVLGPLTRMVGTVFVNRDSRFSTGRLVETVARALEKGSHIHVFAEGTSTNGQRILPFKTALFEAPVRAGAPVQPLTLKYVLVNGRPLTPNARDNICWYGKKMAFVPHTLRLLGTRSLEVEVIFNRRIEPAGSRKQLARQTQALIEENFRPLVD